MAIVQVRTLREFLESDQVIDCDCSNYWTCSHSGPLRLEMAIQRLGWDYDFYAGREDLARAVYCSVCGQRKPTFRLGWKDKPATYTGSHGAGMEIGAATRPDSQPFKWIEPDDWLVGGTRIRKFGPSR
ncbi:MAG TPA: hypothetical protein VL147_21920 [Devosia sp.]|nr:hypothetical protein [Devosia sp.]